MGFYSEGRRGWKVVCTKLEVCLVLLDWGGRSSVWTVAICIVQAHTDEELASFCFYPHLNLLTIWCQVILVQILLDFSGSDLVNQKSIYISHVQLKKVGYFFLFVFEVI